jgi:hypothetical protein
VFELALFPLWKDRLQKDISINMLVLIF